MHAKTHILKNKLPKNYFSAKLHLCLKINYAAVSSSFFLFIVLTLNLNCIHSYNIILN